MPERALIIAIERYPQVTTGFTSADLTGTLKSALEFRDWLVEKWNREKVDGTIYFCSEPKVDGARGATKKDLIEVLIDLEKEGINSTDNLYVYFSGHGFRVAKAREPLADVLVASDFVDVQRSADCCFKLDALIDGLRGSLGHGCHFYFIDACRNEVARAIAGSLLPFSTEGDEEPSWFVLQSTVAGAPALVGGPFPTKLRDGLRGAGKAKVWEPPIVDSMKVRFDSLRRYVKEALEKTQPVTQKTSGVKGESDVVLATISPIELIALTITIVGATSPVKGTATITPFDGVATVHDLTGTSTTVKVLPKYYKVSVAADPLGLDPAGEVPVEVYEDRELTFTVSFLESLTEAPQVAPMLVAVPDGAEVVLRHTATGVEHSFESTAEAKLPAGTYVSMLRQRGGPEIRRHEIEVVPQWQRTDVAPADWHGVAASESIASKVPQEGGSVLLSETLGGPVADTDLNVWLSIIGAGRLIGSRGEFSKIGLLPLADFSTEGPGAPPIYVLAGFASDTVRLRVGINPRDVPPEWHDAARPGSLAGIREAVMHPPPGQYFVTLALDDQPAYTVTSASMPNRGTLIVLTLGDDGQMLVAQYMVPIGHLLDQMPAVVRDNFRSRTPLADIYTLAQLTRAFRERRRIETEFKDHQLQELLESKWLDPIGGALAAYELMRRRASPAALREVAANLERFFGTLPDSAAIARLARGDDRPPSGVPLFLDGLRAFPSYQDWLPYPASLLDFTGPWTAWRDAVHLPG